MGQLYTKQTKKTKSFVMHPVGNDRQTGHCMNR